MGRKTHNLLGSVYSRLTVIAYAGPDKNQHATWRCRCSCGKEIVTNASRLKLGTAKSCGCWRRDRLTIHRATDTAEHVVWSAMKQRCNDPHHMLFHRYGGRGIQVCRRWVEFRNFLDDMGYRPGPEFTLERIDNNGNYTPKNCCWATRKEQRRNSSQSWGVTLGSENLTVQEWSEKSGIPKQTIYMRLHRGWSVERALTTPVQKRKG